MNLANKITVLRIFLIPLFMIFMLIDFSFGEVTLFRQDIPTHHLIGALIFIVASATDWLDGYVARKYNLITNLGKFLDPLADKILVTAALISLVQLQFAPAWIVIIILSREFAVTGIRLIAAGEGEVIAASQLAKWKTTSQIVAIAALLLYNVPFTLISFPFGDVMLWIALILTILTGIDYFWKSRQLLLSSK